MPRLSNRWSAVAVGFIGVVVMLWPHLDVARYTGAAASAATLGALFAMVSAFTNAASVVQTRRLTDTETTSSIVLYFSLFCALGGLLTLPFGWIVPSWKQFAALVGLGACLVVCSLLWPMASIVALNAVVTGFYVLALAYNIRRAAVLGP